MKLKRLLCFLLLLGCLCGCSYSPDVPDIAATTLPVYEFTSMLCQGTELSVGRVVTESVSCLHDYTLQVSQTRILEGTKCIVLSGAGLEDFLEDSFSDSASVIDASAGISLICGTHNHEAHHSHNEEAAHNHSHDSDPHIWLSPANAKVMALNICGGLSAAYPHYEGIFTKNLELLTQKLDVLESYAADSLHVLSCRELITFHDGFSYLADAFHLSIVKAVEEESGSEASAAELKELIECVREHNLSAIFTEQNGSTAAAEIISAETGIPIFTLDMAISGDSYFSAMYNNINTLKEALE